jgi:hypothetical protein
VISLSVAATSALTKQHYVFYVSNPRIEAFVCKALGVGIDETS